MAGYTGKIATAILLTYATVGFAQHVCFDHYDVLHPHRSRPVLCDPASREDVDEHLLRLQRPTFVGQETDGGVYIASDSGDNQTRPNAFEISFTCKDANQDVCQKAQHDFTEAGTIISQVLDLKEPIKVNATFLPFCQDLKICPSNGLTVLGGAAPARSILLKDSDGFLRAYPQSVVKQLSITDRPQFSDFDIFAQVGIAQYRCIGS